MPNHDAFMTFLTGWMDRELSIPTQDIAPDTQILEIGLLDSLQIMELIAATEAQYAISIPLEELVEENFATPTAIHAMVQRSNKD